MRLSIVELAADMGLGWGTAGVGTLALLALSPRARKRARSMLVRAVASGFSLKQQLAQARTGLAQEINQAVQAQMMHAQQPAPASMPISAGVADLV